MDQGNAACAAFQFCTGCGQLKDHQLRPSPSPYLTENLQTPPVSGGP